MSATLYHHMYVRCQVLTELASNRTHLRLLLRWIQGSGRVVPLRGRQRAARVATGEKRVLAVGLRWPAKCQLVSIRTSLRCYLDRVEAARASP